MQTVGALLGTGVLIISALVLQSEEDLPSGETLHWADGFLLVYAITDRCSFNFVRRVKQMLGCDMPLALVGNKGDMVHLRQVSTEEGTR
jgi:Ras-like protein family protein 11A